MEQVKELFKALGQHLEKLAKANAVVARSISVGDRHVIPLCELSLAFGGGGGAGELAGTAGQKPQKGVGGAVGGGAKASPVAVLVIEGGKARLEKIGS